MEWWNCKAFSAVTICSALTIMSYMTFVDVSNDPLATEHGVHSICKRQEKKRDKTKPPNERNIGRERTSLIVNAII